MWFDPFWSFLEDVVFPMPSLKSGKYPLFNPYRDRDPQLDLLDAPAIRRANLRNFLESLPAPPTVLLVGEAPGWHGCRFSGVPFTSESQLTTGYLPFSGKISAREDAPHAEASATVFWKVLQPYHPRFFVWSSLPFHPHRPGEPLSNRTPSRQELRSFLPVLTGMLKLLSPKLILTVGRQAEQALEWLNVPALAVRHPSHGGAAPFESGINAGFRLLKK